MRARAVGVLAAYVPDTLPAAVRSITLPADQVATVQRVVEQLFGARR